MDWIDQLIVTRIIPLCGGILGIMLIVFFLGRWQLNKQSKPEVNH